MIIKDVTGKRLIGLDCTIFTDKVFVGCLLVKQPSKIMRVVDSSNRQFRVKIEDELRSESVATAFFSVTLPTVDIIEFEPKDEAQSQATIDFNFNEKTVDRFVKSENTKKILKIRSAPTKVSALSNLSRDATRIEFGGVSIPLLGLQTVYEQVYYYDATKDINLLEARVTLKYLKFLKDELFGDIRTLEQYPEKTEQVSQFHSVLTELQNWKRLQKLYTFYLFRVDEFATFSDFLSQSCKLIKALGELVEHEDDSNFSITKEIDEQISDYEEMVKNGDSTIDLHQLYSVVREDLSYPFGEYSIRELRKIEWNYKTKQNNSQVAVAKLSQLTYNMNCEDKNNIQEKQNPFLPFPEIASVEEKISEIKTAKVSTCLSVLEYYSKLPTFFKLAVSELLPSFYYKAYYS